VKQKIQRPPTPSPFSEVTSIYLPIWYLMAEFTVVVHEIQTFLSSPKKKGKKNNHQALVPSLAS